ncbi:PaaI family thioesterase [Neomicrococcus lactis]|uniref:PaaI family thioesterase n=1 Tax=Neomicrococcus lactis TaxID=732241 RepID=UPI0022FFE3E7|nr:hotdog fold thioesterase [Neomicrococcus lactis]
MSIWFGDVPLEELNNANRGTLNANLGIEVIEKTENSLIGRMPVDERTTQPAGVVHGGASVAFAETLASWAGFLTIDRERFHAVGLEINANHVRPGLAGQWLRGEATVVNMGRTTQIWDIRITNEEGKLVCISRCTLAIIAQKSAYTTPEQRDASR